MAHWLVKTEPDTYAWSTLQTDGRGVWDGVRNYAARLHLRGMAVGDLVVVYHSGAEKAAVGLARVVRTAYPDPTTDDERWVAVDVAPVCGLVRPVTLAAVRADAEAGGAMKNVRLVRQTRLSVMPLDDAQWHCLLALAGSPDPDA